MRIISTGANGLRAQQLAVDTTADNIANVNTPGFKSRQVDFAEALAVSKQPTGNEGRLSKRNSVLEVGTGVVYRGTPFSTEQGQFLKTENPFDLAIDGNGFFQIQLPTGGSAYTRAGNFKLDFYEQPGGNVGRLVDGQGNIVKTLNPLSIPENASDISVTETGQIIGLENREKKNYGQIVTVGFNDPSLLSSIGDSLFVETATSGEPAELLPGDVNTGKIRSHTLELSNVNLAKEMSELIQAQRAYQMNVRIIQDGDRMWEIANFLRR